MTHLRLEPDSQVAMREPNSAEPGSQIDISGIAHELWAVAQLAPGEGIVDAVDRIEELIREQLIQSPRLTAPVNREPGSRPILPPAPDSLSDIDVWVEQQQSVRAIMAHPDPDGDVVPPALSIGTGESVK